MIYNLKKSDCYSISGKLILDNKYARVEGDQYKSFYVQKLLYSGNQGKYTSTGRLGVAKDTKTYYTAGMRYTFSFSFYNEKVQVGQLVSEEVMSTDANSFVTMIEGSNITSKTAQLGTGKPNIVASFPSLSDLTSSSDFLELAYTRLKNHAEQWLGQAVVNYADVSSNAVSPIINYIDEIVIRYDWRDSFGEMHTGMLAGPYVTISDFKYTVKSSNFFQESSSFSYGQSNSLLTYKLPDNELMDIESYYIEGDETKSVIAKAAERILNNYKKGKQVVNIECPTLNIIDTNGDIHTRHIFEPGQYFYILDELGSSLFNYKLTNIPKIFEIISAEYVRENWNIVLKEVAKVESN